MATIMDSVVAIINNNAIAQNVFYLYERWQDESKYEDINDYGKAIHKAIVKEYPNLGAEYVGATKRPFGVKIMISGNVFHIHTKLKGRYVVLCAKKCS